MGPGGSPGLQNRVCPDKIGMGGFDSHVLPQIKRFCEKQSLFYFEMEGFSRRDSSSESFGPMEDFHVLQQTKGYVEIQSLYFYQYINTISHYFFNLLKEK